MYANYVFSFVYCCYLLLLYVLFLCYTILYMLRTHTHTHIYIYMYIHICMETQKAHNRGLQLKGNAKKASWPCLFLAKEWHTQNEPQRWCSTFGTWRILNSCISLSHLWGWLAGSAEGSKESQSDIQGTGKPPDHLKEIFHDWAGPGPEKHENRASSGVKDYSFILQ